MMPETSEKEKLIVQESDTTLVEAAIYGDAESFTELCRRYYPAMVAIAHSILGDGHLAEDATQEAFAKAAVKLPQLTTLLLAGGGAIWRRHGRTRRSLSDLHRRTDEQNRRQDE